MTKILSFDIGGTKIAYAIIDENGKFLSAIVKEPTPKTSAEIYDLLKATVKKFEAEIDGVAIATAGGVNNEGTKITSHVGNLPEGYNKTDFVSLTAKSVLVENDANSAGWAEFAAGAAKGCKNAVVLTLGTGVGSGIIVNGALLKGKSGAAGEMHFPVDTGCKRKCSCGLEDCFEIFASGTALNLNAKEFMGENATSYDVIAGLKTGDQNARAAFDKWQDYLLKGLIMLGNIFDPEMIVLSGSMAEFVEYEKLNAQANAKILTQPFVLKKAVFENNAGMIGAALLLAKKLK
ncbi:MAG: ROK family protein [Alphaproteobacteria bacterium]|nr:ROK family protein [Alphaproteobacteria bacterium]